MVPHVAELEAIDTVEKAEGACKLTVVRSSAGRANRGTKSWHAPSFTDSLQYSAV
jgi:hypothetical protein